MTQLATDRLVLRLAEKSQAAAMAEFFLRNRAHFMPWDPPRPPDFYTAEGWLRRLTTWVEEEKAGRSRRWACAPEADPDLIVGTVHLSEICRGNFQACYLGYAIDAAYEGTGTMSEAVSAVVDHAFEVMGLHRIMANYVPENERSGRLLQRLGFRVEGCALDYIFIDGTWRDHVLTGRVNPNPQPPPQV